MISFLQAQEVAFFSFNPSERLRIAQAQREDLFSMFGVIGSTIYVGHFPFTKWGGNFLGYIASTGTERTFS